MPLFNYVFFFCLFFCSAISPLLAVPYGLTAKPVPSALSPLIVIDAGHGGHDLGTQALLPPPCYEKELTLKLSLFLKYFLQQMGCRTALTRCEDIFLSLSDRALFANNRQARLFISVHFNAAKNTKAHGIEVFYYHSEPHARRSQQSKRLAKHVLERLLANTKALSRGVKHGNLAVVRETAMPAILVEGGFMTNDQEMEKLRDTLYLKQIAWGIAQGVRDFLAADRRTF